MADFETLDLASQAVKLMDNEADLRDATRRFRAPLPAQTKFPPQPKWIGEKHWPLNPSNSKELVLGYRLEYMLTPFAALQSPGGIALCLSAEELKKLFDPIVYERIKDFLKGDSAASDFKLSDAAIMKCVVLPHQGNGVKVVKAVGDSEVYISLGDVSIRRLYSLSKPLLSSLQRLQDHQHQVVELTVNLLRKIKNNIPLEAQLVTSYETIQFVQEVAGEFLSLRERKEGGKYMTDFYCNVQEDLLFKHFEAFNMMAYDHCIEPL